MKRQSETKPISADGNSPFFRRLAGWQAFKPRCQSAHATIAPAQIIPSADALVPEEANMSGTRSRVADQLRAELHKVCLSVAAKCFE